MKTTLEVALPGITFAPPSRSHSAQRSGGREISFNGQQQGFADSTSITPCFAKVSILSASFASEPALATISLVDHIRISHQPELAADRRPIRDAEETATVVSKLISYSQSKPFASVALVSDANDGFNFEQASAQLRPLFPSSMKIDEIRRGKLDSTKAKALLVEAINRGQKLINYVGHGSANQWRGSLLTSADASAMTNKDRLPVFVMMTCLNGYFHDAASNSLAESLIKAEHGGAIAVWASSGMTLPAA